MDANLNERKKVIFVIVTYTIFHNFCEKFTSLTLFVGFTFFFFFYFLISALVQLFPLQKNAHPKALFLNKRPVRLIGYMVCEDFQISMLYHFTFHESIL